MSPEKDKKLTDTFPLLYSDRYGNMQETCMCWGFPENGWYGIIWRLSEKLEPLIQELIRSGKLPCLNCGYDKSFHIKPGTTFLTTLFVSFKSFFKRTKDCCCNKYEPDYPRASQVKEKFGCLRFYMSSETDEMSDLIEEAEEESSVTCSNCGLPGLPGNKGGWITTLCSLCNNISELDGLRDLRGI